MLFLRTSCNISNFFLKELMLICANINLFGFLSLNSSKSLQLCVKGLGLSELPPSSTSGQRTSPFWEKSQSKNFLWKLPAFCHHLLKLLTFLSKLIANLPKPWPFKYNSPQLNPALLILLLSMMSSCSVDKCLFKLLTVSEALPLSFLLRSHRT